jgi:splicing factor 3A subunit 3
LTFLSEFYKIEKIPIYLKKQDNYREYLNSIYRYLKTFLAKSNPMVDINSILDSIDEEFEQSWKEANIPGWETYLKQLRNLQEDSNLKIDALEPENNSEIYSNNRENSNKNNENPLFCIACQKLFTNPSVFEHHKKGKNHIKNAEKLKEELTSNNIQNINYNSNNNINTNKKEALNLSLNEDEKNINQLSHNSKLLLKIKEANESKEEEIRSIAYFEFSVCKFCEILSDVLENTQNTIRKKQSRNYNEIEAEMENSEEEEQKDEESEDNEKPIYNPKNVPLGWDGKPIPYWLYKLHGLGIEYKCEICGGASYWGRRAFERHFQEWRHSYGMKCLKIPNTVHFKEVTSIEDSLRRNIIDYLFYN